MLALPVASLTLMNRAVTSLAAWHLIEVLADGPATGMATAALVGLTGLEVTEVRRALDSLRQAGLVKPVSAHGVALTLRHAAGLRRLVARAAADRALRMAILKQAARRELSAGHMAMTIEAAPLSERRSPR